MMRKWRCRLWFSGDADRVAPAALAFPCFRLITLLQRADLSPLAEPFLTTVRLWWFCFTCELPIIMRSPLVPCTVVPPATNRHKVEM